MKRIIFFLFILALFGKNETSAQAIGDTIKVQAFKYSSSSRDSTIIFPNLPNVKYEKILMRYAMRCKGALVSSGSQRNLGCGEWDYSCNTYVQDSSRIDSIDASVQRYVVNPSSNPNNNYSQTQTWSAYPSAQQNVNLNSILNEDTASIGSGTVGDTNFIASAKNGKTLVIYTQAELSNAGLVSGGIDGLSFNCTNSAAILKNFRIRLKEVSASNIASIDTSFFNGLQEVYFYNTSLSLGWNRIQFYQSFNWTGNGNLLVEISYDGTANGPNVELATSSTGSSTGALYSRGDFTLDLFQGNYVTANAYKGIPSNNDRTVEAWIKTTGTGEITTWGTNSTGQKQSFMVNGSGQLRLEVSNGSTVGTKSINDGKWHHVAYRFSGQNMYDVIFYIDGAWDFPSSVTTKPMNTGNSRNFEISRGFHNRYFNGEIDGVRVWEAALSLGTVRNWRYSAITSSHPNYASLALHYENEGNSMTISDLSSNSNDAQFNGAPRFNNLKGVEQFKNLRSYNARPNAHFYQGSYNMTVQLDTLYDTIPNNPFVVTENTIYSRPGTIYPDSIGTQIFNYWPEANVVYDFSGNVASSNPSSSTLTLVNSTLPYIHRQASKLEIMSFVTPYGINLDLGVDGKAWWFDVSDFAPVLKGAKRLSLERGGQNQEEMDIQFFYIVGTPPADQHDIRQIWRVDQRNYSQINSNQYYEPRTIRLDPNSKRFKIRSSITGHGQEGEFIPRNHFININNGAAVFNRLVWKECAENPVYPQGGTWIYDRAGWCPGMATDIGEHDVTAYVAQDSLLVDYGMSAATGDSRYIVSQQIVSYGDINFMNDARVIEILKPNSNIAYERTNPSCHAPEIVIQNTGSAVLSSAVIDYWANNGTHQTYNWSGSLNFMDKATIVLPLPAGFWTNIQGAGNSFYARIAGVNGGADQYIHNDTLQSYFKLPAVLPNNFYISLRTNVASNQTSYDLRDDLGNIIFQKSGLNPNQNYVDSISLSPGCYRINLYDSNDDGLSFFANSAGTGWFRLLDLNGSTIQNFNPDFGDGISFDFTVSFPLALDQEEELNSLALFPNPSDGIVWLNSSFNLKRIIVQDALGKLVYEKNAFNNGNEKAIKLDLNHLKSGLYYINIQNNKESTTQKLILK